MLTKLKREPDHAWLNDISCVPVQQSLRHLQVAFRNFFEKRTKYPTFKKKFGKQTAEYTKSAFKWDATNRNLVISKLGRLRIRWSRNFDSCPTTVTITKDRANRYFVTLCLDEVKYPVLKNGEAIGIDLGISRLATLSNGERVSNPGHIRKYERKLARAQRAMSRRKKGSKRREKARLRVAKIHAKITDARMDYLNKVTTDIVRRFDTICIEDLNLRDMVKNHALARSLQDASLGTFGQLLKYKCNWYGKELISVDRWFPSSKRCSSCGYINGLLTLKTREWNCPKCGIHHDRDENAALNLLAEGITATDRGTLGSNARGGDVRQSMATAMQCNLPRTVNRLNESA